MSEHTARIIEILQGEKGEAQIADLIGGMAIEPQLLIDELDRLRQEGIVDVRPEALDEIRGFMRGIEFKSATSIADRHCAVFFHTVKPENLAPGFRVSLMRDQPVLT